MATGITETPARQKHIFKVVTAAVFRSLCEASLCGVYEKSHGLRVRFSDAEITQWLTDWSNGDRSALEKLTPLVYRELHRLAHAYMRGERVGHALQTTVLVNEAYLR
jgi:hypothetical protein